MSEFTYNTPVELLNGICDAIREKDGTTEPIKYQDIPQRILDLKSDISMSEDDFIQHVRKCVGNNIVDFTNNSSSIIVSETEVGKIKIPSLSTAWYYLAKMPVEENKKYTISISDMRYGRIGLSKTNSAIPDNNLPNVTPASTSALHTISDDKQLEYTFTANFSGYVYLWFCSDKADATGNRSAYTEYLLCEEGDYSTLFYKTVSDKELSLIYKLIIMQ